MTELNGKNLIGCGSNNISYMGRIDLSHEDMAVLYYAGSSVRMRFKGTEIGIVIRNKYLSLINYLGYIIDGKENKIRLDDNKEKVYIPLAKNLDNTEHEIIIFKRQDATHYVEFYGFALNKEGESLKPAPIPTRKIECFGDSVSAGAVCEAIDHTARLDPDNHQAVYDNAWHSYSMITARNLGASINNNAQGGIALFDKTGYFHYPDYIGMESAYDKLCYYPEGTDGITPWDFSKYTPHVVLFAIGQNDPHNEGHEDFDISDKDYRLKWKTAYKKIIMDLRTKYPNAVIILLLTVLMHDPQWDKAIDEIANELNDPKITHFMFTRTGKATPGHPRIPEQCEMAEELTAYISSMGDKVWEN